jgi:tRNA 2-thiouridine synthesizing protein C
MISSCSIIVRKPLSIEGATLGIRAAWAMLTNGGIGIKMILMGDGLYGLLGKSGYIKDMYVRYLGEDGEVYLVKEDMEARGLTKDMFPDGVEVISQSEIPGLIEETDSVMTF